MKSKKNNYLFSLTVILITSILMVSCDNLGNQNDITGLSTLKPTNPSITIVKDFSTVSGIESNTTYPFTLVLSEPQSVDIHIAFYQSGGTATEDLDFKLATHDIVIPAYTTSVESSFSIIRDDLPEGTETLSLTVGNERNANTTFTSETFNFTIENYLANYLDISFAWAQDVTLSFGTFSTSNNVDLDIFVADAIGYNNNNPWATFNGTGFAATGSEPEQLTMDMATWGDGEYILFHDLWSNNFFGLGLTTTLNPITATFVRPGGISSTVIVQDPTQTMNLETPGFTQGGSHNGFIAKVTIANGIITIADFNNTVVASGKINSSSMSKRPSYLYK